MDRIRAGVIGAGHLGKIHARIYSELPEAELAGVCDVDPARAQEIAAKYHTRPFTDYTELLRQVDCVSVATPTVTHHRVGSDCLRAGIHVLIEKPVAAKIREADRLLKLAEEKGLILQVGHSERFNGCLQAVLPHCRNPRFIECHRLGPFKLRSVDVGAVLDLMIHDIDIVLSLVRSPVKTIDAIGVKVLTGSEDLANVRLIFENGAVANLTASRLTEKEMRKVRIFQDDAYFSLDFLNQTITGYGKDGNRVVSRLIPVEKKEPLLDEIKSFLDCVRTGRRPLVSGIEGKAALETALKITRKIRSRWEDRT